MYRALILLLLVFGHVGIGTTSPGGRLHAKGSDSAAIVGILQGAASQSADLLQAQNSSGNVLAGITAAGALYRKGVNAQQTKIDQATVQSGAMSGATLTLTNLIPAGSLVFGVTVHPTTTVASGDGGTTYSVGDGTDVDRWGAAIAFAADVTLANITIQSPVFYTAATSVVLTCDGGKTFNAGVVRVTVHYLTLTPATS